LKTKNQIKKVFQDFANSHLQIHQFGYGEEFEQQAVEGIQYPLLWVVPLPSPLSGVDLDRSYRIILADRVRKDESDEIEVESDTELYLLDTLSYLYKYSLQNELNLLDGQTINPFWEKWSDEVTGHYADITLRDYFDYNSCALPLADIIPTNEFPSTGGVIFSPSVFSKAITIAAPVITDDIPLFFSFSEITTLQINDVLSGTNPSLSYNIYFDEDKNSVTPTKLWNTDRTASDVAGSEADVFDNRVIPANNWVWIKPSVKTGTVDLFSFNIFYKIIL
jgi:hypothetical protein